MELVKNEKGQMLIVLPIIAVLGILGAFLFQGALVQNVSLKQSKELSEMNILLETVVEKTKEALTTKAVSCVRFDQLFQGSERIEYNISQLRGCLISEADADKFETVRLVLTRTPNSEESLSEVFRIKLVLEVDLKKTEGHILKKREIEREISISPIRLAQFGLILYGNQPRFEVTSNLSMHSPVYMPSSAIQELISSGQSLSRLSFYAPVYSNSSTFSFTGGNRYHEVVGSFHQGIRSQRNLSSYQWPFEQSASLYSQRFDYGYVYRTPTLYPLPFLSFPVATNDRTTFNGSGYTIAIDKPIDVSRANVSAIPDPRFLPDLSMTCAISSPDALGGVRPYVFLGINSPLTIDFSQNGAKPLMFCGLIVAREIVIKVSPRTENFIIGSLLTTSLKIVGDGKVHLVSPYTVSVQAAQLAFPMPSQSIFPFSLSGIRSQFDILRVTTGRNFFVPLAQNYDQIPAHTLPQSIQDKFEKCLILDNFESGTSYHYESNYYCYKLSISTPRWSDLFTNDWYSNLAVRIVDE